MEGRIFIPTTRGYDIPMVLVFPDGGRDRYPGMLLLHGFMAYKEGDGYLLRKIAEGLQANGIVSLK